MAATISDVAKLAGCSITTVSRAFSAPGKVREDTLSRIMQAAQTLNYSPNAIARAMVQQKNRSIAFVINEAQNPDGVINPFYSSIARTVQTEAAKYQFDVYTAYSNELDMDSASLFLNKRVDGMILAGQTNIQLLSRILATHVPVVLVNNYVEHPDVVSVTSDDFGGAVSAIEHLIARGHTQIGLISGRLFPYISGSRYQAYMETMAIHRLPVYPGYIRQVEPTMEAALACVTEMLQSGQAPTALFCMNDLIAVGAIKAALRSGLRVPEDLAVVGFDGSSISTIVEPELTTVSVDTAQMGRFSVQKLMRMIAGEQITENHLEIKTQLVVRQSS